MRLDAVGDFVLTSPAIRAVRENYPSANITLVVSKQIYPLAQLCPYVNEVLPFDAPKGCNILQIIQSVTNFAATHLWQKRFKLAIIFQYWMDIWCSFMAYISGSKERIGYIRDGLSQIINTYPVPERPQDFIHDLTKDIGILKAMGLNVRQTECEIWYNQNDLYNATKILHGFADGRLKVVTAIGANHKERRYPVEKYLIAFKEIIAKGAALIIIGGKSEVDGAKFLEDNLPKGFVKNLVEIGAGWRVDAAVISKADIYVGNMTGACDVAATLKKPVIALSRVARDRKKFFPNALTEFEMYYPWQTNSIVLQPEHQLDDCQFKPSFGGCSAGKSHCIGQIKPEEIVAAFDEMVHFIKYSGIRKISCPPIIRGINQISPLKFGFEFNKD